MTTSDHRTRIRLDQDVPIICVTVRARHDSFADRGAFVASGMKPAPSRASRGPDTTLACLQETERSWTAKTNRNQPHRHRPASGGVDASAADDAIGQWHKEHGQWPTRTSPVDRPVEGGEQCRRSSPTSPCRSTGT